MLKRLTAVPSDGSILAPEADEAACGVGQEYSLEAALEESRKASPFVPPADIWPNWSAGRPSKFRLTYSWEPFSRKGVSYRWHKRTETLELEWQSPVLLSSIAKRSKALLPPDYTYAWSGVYRIFQPGSQFQGFSIKTPRGHFTLARRELRETGRTYELEFAKLHIEVTTSPSVGAMKAGSVRAILGMPSTSNGRSRVLG